jgi:excisionase family DNA binding protein
MAHIKRSARKASPDADSAYRKLQLRIASEIAGFCGAGATENPGNREFLRAREAAIWLGVPLRSLHQYVQQGLLPSYKLGRHRLFRKGELLSALGADRTPSRSEILR